MMMKRKDNLEFDPKAITESIEKEINEEADEQSDESFFYRFRDKYVTVTLICGILIAICSFMPWVMWTAETGTVYYNAVDLVSFKWEGALSVTRYFPAISCVLGMVIVILSVMKERAVRFYILLIAGLLCAINIVVFLMGILYYTGLEAYFALVIVFVCSLLVIFSTTKRVDIISKTYRKKREEERKKKAE